MSRLRRQPHEAGSAPPPRVRIVTRRGPPRAGTVALIVTIVAVALLPLVWHLLQTEQDVPSPSRSLATEQLDWKCEHGHLLRAAGHAFNAEGLTAPRVCWVCGQPAFPVTRFVCPVHGSFEVSVQFGLGDDGIERISRVRLSGRNWVGIEKGIRCPHCNRPLTHAKDPLKGWRTRQKHRGG